MAAFCPDLIYTQEPEGGGSWFGPITPIKSTERLLDLLDDIHHNNAIYMASGAELRHLHACGKTHCKHPWMEEIRPEDLARTFDALITYSGGRDDPRCWIMGLDFTNGRHMWNDGSICPFLSSSTTWDWMVDTVADFAGHVSVFLVSWMTFQRTGIWIVGEHRNTGTYHVSTIRPNDLCWCRSGKKYRKCHMQQDQALAWRGR
jgi:SEC-C motif